MSRDLTNHFVFAQIRAMAVANFEVGAYKLDHIGSPHEPTMLLRTWSAETVCRSVPWLKLQNSRGRNIYIRPNGEHPLNLIDDLSYETIQKMKLEGFAPCAVVETSLGNFQAWVNYGEVVPREVSTLAARLLCQRFHGDPGSADWRHFGRLAGFTNRKDKHRQSGGLWPFVKLIEANGTVFPEAGRFLGDVRQALAELGKQHRQRFSAASSTSGQLLTIDDFRGRSEYQGDGNRIDLAYAIYALSHGVSESEVRHLIASRDLTHKGPEQRQIDYINRTVKKALREVRPAHER